MKSRHQTKFRGTPDERTEEIGPLDIDDVSVGEPRTPHPSREFPMIFEVGPKRFLRHGHKPDIPVSNRRPISHNCDPESQLRQATAEFESVSPGASDVEAERVHRGNEENLNSCNLLLSNPPIPIFMDDAPYPDGSGRQKRSR